MTAMKVVVREGRETRGIKKWIFALFAVAVAVPAFADRLPVPAGAPKSFATECGSCHMAFPPALLSWSDWKRVMGSLDRHYGADASLDAKTAAEIGDFLAGNAGSGMKSLGSGNPPRITAAWWFKRDHDEVPGRLWNDTRVKSASNCAACHRQAESGRFSEHDLVLPELREEEDRR